MASILWSIHFSRKPQVSRAWLQLARDFYSDALPTGCSRRFSERDTRAGSVE